MAPAPSITREIAEPAVSSFQGMDLASGIIIGAVLVILPLLLVEFWSYRKK